MSDDPTRREPVPDEALSALLDGELGPEEATRVRAAVAASPEAARRFERLERLQGALHALPARELPEDLHARLRARIAAESLPPRTAPRARLAWVAGAALATAAGGAALLWLPRALPDAPGPGHESQSVAGPDDPIEEFLAATPAAAPEDAEVIEVLDWLAELGDVGGGRS